MRGEGAALGLVEQDEVVVDTNVLGALIHNLCIRRLERDRQYEINKKIKSAQIFGNKVEKCQVSSIYE